MGIATPTMEKLVALTLEDATRDTARDLMLAHILSVLANAGTRNPLEWLDIEANRLGTILSVATLNSHQGGEAIPTDEDAMDLIKVHLDQLFAQARGLQSDAARKAYASRLTTRPAGPGKT